MKNAKNKAIENIYHREEKKHEMAKKMSEALKKKKESREHIAGLRKDIEVGWNHGKELPNESSYKSVRRNVDKYIRKK